MFARGTLLAPLAIVLIYTTGALLLLCKTPLRVSAHFFLGLAAVYLIFLLRLVLVPPYDRFYGSIPEDAVDLMSKTFALPGLIVSLFAAWNEKRYSAATKSYGSQLAATQW